MKTRRIGKNKTSTKKQSVNPYFNEDFDFKLDPEDVRVRLSACQHKEERLTECHHVGMLGKNCQHVGLELSPWWYIRLRFQHFSMTVEMSSYYVSFIFRIAVL